MKKTLLLGATLMGILLACQPTSSDTAQTYKDDTADAACTSLRSAHDLHNLLSDELYRTHGRLGKYQLEMPDGRRVRYISTQDMLDFSLLFASDDQAPKDPWLYSWNNNSVEIQVSDTEIITLDDVDEDTWQAAVTNAEGHLDDGELILGDLCSSDSRIQIAGACGISCDNSGTGEDEYVEGKLRCFEIGVDKCLPGYWVAQLATKFVDPWVNWPLKHGHITTPRGDKLTGVVDGHVLDFSSHLDNMTDPGMYTLEISMTNEDLGRDATLGTVFSLR